MSDDNFIARWSRLKREAEDEKSRSKQPVAHGVRPLAQDVGASHEHGREGSAPATDVEPPFDPATLPPIESIVAGTDIRAFLQKGVPTELTKAALRRAWSTDPAIRDFIEMAENQWDFTDPASIPGFGALQAGDDVRQLAAQAMGQLSTPQSAAHTGDMREEGARSHAPRQSASTPAPVAPAPPEPESEEEQHYAAAPAAAQHPECTATSMPIPKRKGHGAAMPR